MSEQPQSIIGTDEIVRRFDKIESKLDTLSEAMIKLARNEEKLEALQERMNTHSVRLNKQSEEIYELQKDNTQNSQVTKIFWTIIAGLVVSVATMYLKQ